MQVTKISSHFVGQKETNFAGIIQYSNQLFENKEQLVNTDIEYLFSFSNYRNNLRAESNYALTIT